MKKILNCVFISTFFSIFIFSACSKESDEPEKGVISEFTERTGREASENIKSSLDKARSLQERVLKVIGIEKKEAEAKFGFLMNAFKYGAPPHGGIGLGFDRIIALMCGTNDIREVIVYPKNKNAQSPLDGCPDQISEKQKKELYVESTYKKKK